jgi:hypothetical protein
MNRSEPLMNKGPGIIRKEAVEMRGARRIGEGGPAPDARPEGAARIVEQTDEFAVIEVTCACGRKTTLRCAYAS